MSIESLVQQSANALVDTRDELKPYLGVDSDDTGLDERLNQVNNWISAEIEAYLDRDLVSRGAITEYHSFWSDSSRLYTLQWPIRAATSIHEDVNRSYGASTLLTVDDDYIVHKAKGQITRVYSSGSGARNWQQGHRAIQVVYTAGYEDTASIPDSIKYAALRAMALVWREVQRKQQGLSSVSDDRGSLSRFFPAGLTAGIKKSLFSEKRSHFGDAPGPSYAEVDT